MLISFMFTRSVMKKYWMLICLEDSCRLKPYHFALTELSTCCPVTASSQQFHIPVTIRNSESKAWMASYHQRQLICSQLISLCSTSASMKQQWEILDPLSTHHLCGRVCLDAQQTRHQRTTSTARHSRHLEPEVNLGHLSSTPSDGITFPNHQYWEP